jgi:hypothetical protein
MKNKKILALAAITIVSALSSLKAETLSIYDDTFSVNGLPGGSATTILSGRWGVWNPGTATFVQAITTSLNAGYVEIAAPELVITLNQGSNVNYTAGTQMALAIFARTSIADSQNLNWTSTGVNYGAVLTDTSWLAPTFNVNANPVSFLLTANTTALVGSYSFNSGNQTIGVADLSLAAIPEPSVASLLALGTVGLVALRVRRKS